MRAVGLFLKGIVIVVLAAAMLVVATALTFVQSIGERFSKSRPVLPARAEATVKKAA